MGKSVAEIRREILAEVEREVLQQRQPEASKATSARLSSTRLVKNDSSLDLFGREKQPATPKLTTRCPATPRSRQEAQQPLSARQAGLPSGHSRESTPSRRAQDSWWSAACVAGLPSSQKGNGEVLESPLATSRSRKELRQAMVGSQSLNHIGAESGALLSPSFLSQDICRYHSDNGRIRGLARVETKENQSNYLAREECRFFRAPVTERLMRSSDQKQTEESDRAAAGKRTSHDRRFDTPAGEAALMGRARSQTPDYHQRYSQSAIGTSLPGCSQNGGDAAGCHGVVRQSTPRPARRVLSGQASASAASLRSKNACHFYRDKEDGKHLARMVHKQAYNMSSTLVHKDPSAGELRNRCLQPQASARRPIGDSANLKISQRQVSADSRPAWT